MTRTDAPVTQMDASTTRTTAATTSAEALTAATTATATGEAAPAATATEEAASTVTATATAIEQGRRKRSLRRILLISLFLILIAAGFAVSLMFGHTFYPPGDILRVIAGQEVAGASFTVGVLRLPRATLAVVAGLCFGLSGCAFQTMLRNALASPDIIGISAGASAAAVFGIVVLSLSAATISAFAILSGLGVALVVYLLAYRKGVEGPRLILVGIGVAAVLDSVTAYLMTQAAEWNMQEALRWMTGSLNGTSWDQVIPVVFALAVFGSLLFSQTSNLAASQLGDDTASALGVRVSRTRLLITLASVGLISFATAAAGPVAFVAFLSGPIANRLLGSGGSNLLPAALVGALLMLVADFLGQYALGIRYPVGVLTGVLGAPYLIYLIIRTNRGKGG